MAFVVSQGQTVVVQPPLCVCVCEVRETARLVDLGCQYRRMRRADFEDPLGLGRYDEARVKPGSCVWVRYGFRVSRTRDVWMVGW